VPLASILKHTLLFPLRTFSLVVCSSLTEHSRNIHNCDLLFPLRTFTLVVWSSLTHSRNIHNCVSLFPLITFTLVVWSSLIAPIVLALTQLGSHSPHTH
jgi:hypothetical protein